MSAKIRIIHIVLMFPFKVFQNAKIIAANSHEILFKKYLVQQL